MGPDLPSRPRFSWDLKNAPWTDAKGPQEGYYDAVVLWKAFQDKLPEGNSNKIPPDLQGIILKSQLFGRAIDLCKKVSDHDVQSANGALTVARAIYKSDPLSVITQTFQKFATVLKTTRNQNESFKNFESRFEATVCNYNAAAPSSQLPESLIAFMLISNANIDDNQRVSILSAAAPKPESGATLNTNELLSKITYEDVASIVRLFDKPKNSTQPPRSSDTPLTAGSANLPNQKGSKYKRKMNREKIADLKRKTACKDCHKKGPWSGDSEREAKEDSSSSMTAPNAIKDDKEAKKRSITFAMVHLKKDEEQPTDSELVLVDDGAPYCGMGVAELKELQFEIMPGWNGVLDPLRDTVRDRPYWKYGRGANASKPKRIVGSVMLTIDSDQGTPINICHLIIEGSSPWVIGRNDTRKGNIMHASGNCIHFPNQSAGKEITLQLTDHDMHRYVKREQFYHCNFPSTRDPTSASLCSLSGKLSWRDTEKILDRVHTHVCGHSNYNDISTLLKRNHIWTEDCPRYLSHLLETYENCHVVDAPPGNRPFSLSSMSREFNDVITIDRFHVDGLDVLHCMDTATRYSAGAVVESTALDDAIEQFEAC